MKLFDYENVPEELKEASRKLKAAIQRHRKAAAQRVAWEAELQDALRCLKTEEESYGTVSMRWDPETDTMKPALEAAPAASA